MGTGFFSFIKYKIDFAPAIKSDEVLPFDFSIYSSISIVFPRLKNWFISPLQIFNTFSEKYEKILAEPILDNNFKERDKRMKY